MPAESSYTESQRRIPRPHHNFVPEYQMSGIPHTETRNLADATLVGSDNLAASSGDNDASISNISNFKFTFNSVTRWLIINNHSNNANHHIRVYFNETAAKTAYASSANQDVHYYEINGDQQSNRLELKCKEVYIIPENFGENFDVSIVAGLTNVFSSDFPDQTKANGFLGVED